VPSSAEFATAIELGMGWGMLPRLQCAEALARGRLVELMPGSAFELPLYWQRWNLRSPVLDRLSAIIAEDAALALDVGGAR
jgi:LysR family transcriptional regulator (chromosome initiation inhibitor)